MVLQNYGYLKVPEYVKKMLDEISGQNREYLIVQYLIRIAGFTGLLMVSMFIMRKIIIGVSRKIEYGLRNAIYRKLLSLKYVFFEERETGDLISRSTNDLNDVRTLLGPGLMYVPNSLTRLALFLPVLFSLNQTLVLIVGLIMLFLVLLIFTIMPKLRPLFKRIQETSGYINNHVWQVITGIQTIKLTVNEKIQFNRFAKLNKTYIDRNMAAVKLRGALWPLFIFIFAIAEIVVVAYGGRMVIQNRLTLGELMQFNLMIGYLTFPILSLGWIMSLIQQGLSAMERISEILAEPRTDTLNYHEKLPEKVSIEVRQLNWSYGDNSPAVLKDINLSIQPGEIIGITGSIGSGKSTFIRLLVGLYDPPENTIFMNNRDVREIPPAMKYDIFSVVPQDPFLFSRSIAENIAVGSGGEVDMDEIVRVTKMAAFHDEIISFSRKYEEIIGERGITLSGGQKQRLAIARGLIRRAPVLILDDSLSSVDAQTENKILEKLEKQHQNQSLIIISHRISPLKKADRILVFDKGRIVEQGTHEDLIQNDGLYANLATMQQLEEELETISVP